MQNIHQNFLMITEIFRIKIYEQIFKFHHTNKLFEEKNFVLHHFDNFDHITDFNENMNMIKFKSCYE